MVSRLWRVTYNRWWVISCSHSLLPPCLPPYPIPHFLPPRKSKRVHKKESTLYISQKQTHFFHLWFGPKRIGNFNFDCAAMIVRCADDDGGGAWVAEQKVLIMSFCSPPFSHSFSLHHHHRVPFHFQCAVKFMITTAQRNKLKFLHKFSNVRRKALLQRMPQWKYRDACKLLFSLIPSTSSRRAVRVKERRDPRRRWNEFFIVSNSSLSLTRSHTF